MIKKKKTKKKRKKLKKYEDNYSLSSFDYYQQKSLFSLLMENHIVQFILIFIIGWIYVGIWMNTSYYDPYKELLDQPNLEVAFVPPWILTFFYFLWGKISPNDYIGGNLLTHVLSGLFISLFVVLSCFGMMLLGLIIFGLFGVTLGLIF